MLSKTVTLKSSEGEAFEVVEAVAMQSQTIKHMIEDECADGVIPVPNVTSKILVKVIEYCKKHVESPKTDDRSADYELKTWDADFVKVDQATLSDLLLAAKFLEINSLLNLTWRKVKEMIQGKTPEEIWKMFNMKIDPESLPYLVTVTLKSSDGELFKVMEAVAVESQTIKHMIEDGCADGIIPVPNVTSKILAKVIKYCHKHVESRKTDDCNANNELKTWDADFFKVDQATLFDLILAANYLNIKSLLDMACQTVADMIKGKTPQEIRNTFNLNLNGLTPEEEEEVRRENAWAFE